MTSPADMSLAATTYLKEYVNHVNCFRRKYEYIPSNFEGFPHSEGKAVSVVVPVDVRVGPAAEVHAAPALAPEPAAGVAHVAVAKRARRLRRRPHRVVGDRAVIIVSE